MVEVGGDSIKKNGLKTSLKKKEKKRKRKQ